MSLAAFADDSPQAQRYNKIHRRLGIADAMLGIAMLIVLLVTGWTKKLAHFSLVVVANDHYLIGLFVYVLFLLLAGKILSFGLDYYAFRLENEYHLSNQKLGSWVWDQFKGFLVGLVLASILAELLYALILFFPQGWWLIAWASFLALAVFFAQIAPVALFPIFYKFRPLEDDALRERLTSLGKRAGTNVRGVYEWQLSEKSNKANAALTGLGNTRRIILADTLLKNYSQDEIEAVLAHELGHHVHKHIFKSIVVQAVITFIGFWAVKMVLRWAVLDQGWFTRDYDFANLPLIVLLATMMSLLLTPVMNAYSRFNERQADRYAWEAIPSTAPFVTAMNKLAEQNLSERTPARWVEVLFHSHPPISKRISAAEQWAREKN